MSKLYPMREDGLINTRMTDEQRAEALSVRHKGDMAEHDDSNLYKGPTTALGADNRPPLAYPYVPQTPLMRFPAPPLGQPHVLRVFINPLQ